MRRALIGIGSLSIFLMGYILGSTDALQANFLNAQDAQDVEFGPETLTRLKSTNETVNTTMTTLEAEGKYVPAIEGINAFAATVGGVNAMDDLETGRGVDPETFAGLYAGMAREEIKKDLGRDAEGRLTYKKKIVRMYSIDQLKELFERRKQLHAGEIK